METRTAMAMFSRARSGLLQALLFCGVLLCLAGCSVGPNYKRPAVTVPTAYRGATASEAPSKEATPSSANPSPSSTSPAASLGDEKWWEVFQDK
jgi:multidrug efflux system outer membrane protein